MYNTGLAISVTPVSQIQKTGKGTRFAGTPIGDLGRKKERVLWSDRDLNVLLISSIMTSHWGSVGQIERFIINHVINPTLPLPSQR